MARKKVIDGVTYFKSRYCKNYTKVWVNDSMSAKMQDVPCIGTACTCNPYCIARWNKGGFICSHCFAKGTLTRYKKVNEYGEQNAKLFTSRILLTDELPIFKDGVEICRFEPFGDLINETQAINYLKICKANPSVKFALWTKNTGIICRVLEKCGKPSNLNLIISNPYMNGDSWIDEVFADDPVRKYANAVFSVYADEETAPPINCGARSCNECRLCYSDLDSLTLVNELLK